MRVVIAFNTARFAEHSARLRWGFGGMLGEVLAGPQVGVNFLANGPQSPIFQVKTHVAGLNVNH